MKVAVPVFRDEVSPRFGCSSQALLAVVGADSVDCEKFLDLSAMTPWQWPEYFANQGVEKVICGGMHARFQAEFERRGIEVIWGVVGPAADALDALRAGTLRRDQFVCRGCGRGGPGRKGVCNRRRGERQQSD